MMVGKPFGLLHGNIGIVLKLKEHPFRMSRSSLFRNNNKQKPLAWLV